MSRTSSRTCVTPPSSNAARLRASGSGSPERIRSLTRRSMWYCNSRLRSPSSLRSRNQLKIRFIARSPHQKSVGPLPLDGPSYLFQRGVAFARSVSMNRTWPRVPFPIASNRLSASPSAPAGGALDTEIPGLPGRRISRSVRAAEQSRTHAQAPKRGFGESACRACLEEWEIATVAINTSAFYQSGYHNNRSKDEALPLVFRLSTRDYAIGTLDE